MIEFKGTEAKRAGNNIEELRQRTGLSLECFAKSAKISSEYLILLIEGHEDKVSPEIIENILKAGGIRLRAKEYNGEDLKKVLLSITPANPPIVTFI
jgi:hypothetical protein